MIVIELNGKLYHGATAADLARKEGITQQAALKRLQRPDAPKPFAIIRTVADDGKVAREQNVYTPKTIGV